MLTLDDFSGFFQEIHEDEPFPWQKRLLRRIVESNGQWPATLSLPTGAGKTAAIDIALFHLALDANSGTGRRAPVRIAFVVDRRLVVDDAFTRAGKIAKALTAARTPIVARVSGRLQELSGGRVPVIARPLRGGIPREDDWTRTPSQPTVLCSTVDQIGSRLLFRGYGVSDTMKPIHAGLLGSDCLMLLDEAHLAEPFRQTLEWFRTYRGQQWCEVHNGAPYGVVTLTATPGDRAEDMLEEDDRTHPVLAKRLNASKVARLVSPRKLGAKGDSTEEPEDDSRKEGRDLTHRVDAIADEVRGALKHFENSAYGVSAPAIGVVVNRIARARAVLNRIRKDFKDEIEGGTIREPMLMIGPARPVDREGLAGHLAAVRTRTWARDEKRVLEAPLIIVATQCIEAGVDIDLDALITDLAPLDALRQRFGRLNRAGRDIAPYAAIVAMKGDVSTRNDDPVYGKALRPSWEALLAASKQKGDNGVDFGLNAFAIHVTSESLAPKADAPVLLPAHLDLLSQTSPRPSADPDVALYLHGPRRQPDSITVVWRADLDPNHQDHDAVRRLLTLATPRSTEAVELPVWAVRRWLTRTERNTIAANFADVASAEPNEEDHSRLRGRGREVFCWHGDDDRSAWIAATEVLPGDTIVVPARYGGMDEWGWNPESNAEVTDVGQEAAQPFAGRRLALRVAPGLVGDSVSDDALAGAVAGAASQDWKDLRAALLDLPLPDLLREGLEALRAAKAGRVVAYTDLHGFDDLNRPRGVVFVAPLGISGKAYVEDGQPGATEDDVAGSMPGFSLKLADHNEDVGKQAETFARIAGLPKACIADLALAGHLHDLGKADPRFQAWLHFGDPLAPEPDHILAKSARRLPRTARAAAGLPPYWRHEALSVRRALGDSRFAQAHDPELVLWLIGTHHGHGRPLFPHQDPEERALDVGPQSLAFEWQGIDWPSLFVRLRARYGTWELARLEAILRLADHRASEARAPEGRSQ